MSMAVVVRDPSGGWRAKTITDDGCVVEGSLTMSARDAAVLERLFQHTLPPDENPFYDNAPDSRSGF